LYRAKPCVEAVWRLATLLRTVPEKTHVKYPVAMHVIRLFSNPNKKGDDKMVQRVDDGVRKEPITVHNGLAVNSNLCDGLLPVLAVKVK